MLNQKKKYMPDVLDCISNLSNDEVFTSPKIANLMLDMLPQELFENPRTKFLDIACKSGVFLREIVKRLDKGIEDVIPDRQARIDHILHKQVFGIAITELTAQLSRRTLYCSKYACAMDGDIWISDDNDSEHGIHETHSYSISEFTNADVSAFCLNPIQGNVRFNVQCKHDYGKGNVCLLCGASKRNFSEYSHAYEMIHIENAFMEVLSNMQWDVIISNPPYQLEDSSMSASASPIYNIFVEQAKKLQPRYLTMIIPSRWMVGGKGLDDFRATMIADKHIRELHDFINSKDCFAGVDIKGGVCYFLRERDGGDSLCKIVTHNAENNVKTSVRYLQEDGVDVFIRQSELVEIKQKVWADASQTSFMTIVSVQKPYGLRTDFFAPTVQVEEDGIRRKVSVTAEEKYNLVTPSEQPIIGGYQILGLIGNKRVWRYVDKDYKFPKANGLGKYKIFIPNAYGCGAIGEVPSTPVLGTPVMACTETFLELGPWDNYIEASNALKYLKTKFFRALVSIIKQTQHTSVTTYQYVPLQDFTNDSDIDWSKSVDDISHQLYAKYGLSDDDISFIETNIEPMDGMEQNANTNDVTK